MASAAAADEQSHQKLPLQEANGRHDTPQLLPAPSLRPPQTQTKPPHLDLPCNAGTPRSKEPVSITVGSIANAYFAPAPGAERMSAWGGSQYGPAQEASQAAALGGHPGFPRIHSPAAAVSPSSNHGDSFPSRSEAIPFASNYMNGIPWEAESAALSLHPPSQQQQPQHAESVNSLKQDLGIPASGSNPTNALYGQLGSHRLGVGPSSQPGRSSGGSNASSNANSKRSRSCHSNQQAAEAVGRRLRAAANSPRHAVEGTEAGSTNKVWPAARSPPRYHQPRYAQTLLPPQHSSVAHTLSVPGTVTHTVSHRTVSHGRSTAFLVVTASGPYL